MQARKKKGRLTCAACYLAGPMTDDVGLGAQWREEVACDLSKWGVVVLNPCEKAIEVGVEDAKARAELHDNHASGNYLAVQSQMKEIRRADLRAVDLSSFLICRLNGSPTVGTYEEMAMATLEQKPILLWLDGTLNKKNMNPWLVAQIDPEYIFESKQELLDFLEAIHFGPEHPSHRKFMLFDFFNLYQEALEGM